MTPAELEAIRGRIAADDGMHTYDDGCAEAEADRAALLAEVERLNKERSDFLAEVCRLRGLIMDGIAAIATSTHENGCWPSEGRHTKGCLARRATLAKLRTEMGVTP